MSVSELSTPATRRVLVAMAAVAASSIAMVTVGHVSDPAAENMTDLPNTFEPAVALARFDSGWYAEIAKNGYWYTPGHQGPVAFFPTYPLVVRGLMMLGVNRWIAGELLSLSCAFLGLLLFRRWAMRVNPAAAPAAFAMILVYPFAEYLYGVMYSDALFFTLAVGAFLALESDRPITAGLLGALATACRPVAPALVLGLLVRSIERRRLAGQRLTWRDFTVLFAGAGFAAYLLFLWLKFDDPFAFAHVQAAPGWDQKPGWETWLKLSWFHMMFPRVAPLVAIRLTGHALVAIGGLFLAVKTFRTLGWGYGTYCLVAMGIPALGSKDFMGIGRYAIAAFPLFITLSVMLAPYPRVRRAWVVVSALILGALAFALGRGGYVS